jgi:predicted DNA-binding ArsR family transcriptional regulator
LKAHKRTREDLGIKEAEDLQYSIFSFVSVPGDIDKELIREKEKALKRKVKRIKAQMLATAESHEAASYCPGKDITSANKKRFQILCIDLEKQVIPIIKDYEALENTLKEIIKLMEMRKQADLHVVRKLKFVPILIEICKRISVCHRNEFKHLGRILEYVIKIINLFCGLRENRNYMLQTNRLSALIELLNWCLNRPTQLLYGITFLP